MLIRLLIGLVGIILGMLIMRLINYKEICNLKDQLLEDDKDTEKIMKSYKVLKQQNIKLKQQLSEFYEIENVPDFEDW